MEEINAIQNLIYKNFQLSEVEVAAIEKALTYPLNYSRMQKMIEMAISAKLDKTTIVSFVIYQVAKDDLQAAQSIMEKLSKEVIDMVADFKSIQNINQLTRSEDVEDIKRLFLVMGKDLRVVMFKLFGVAHDVSVLKLPLNDDQKKLSKTS